MWVVCAIKLAGYKPEDIVKVCFLFKPVYFLFLLLDINSCWMTGSGNSYFVEIVLNVLVLFCFVFKVNSGESSSLYTFLVHFFVRICLVYYVKKKKKK